MVHDLEIEFDLLADDILDAIVERRRCLTAVRGAVAERHLQLILEDVFGSDNVVLIDRDGQPHS